MPGKTKSKETLNAPVNAKESSAPDTSSKALLAEHERLSALYLYNTEMGEKRTSLYVTVISAGVALALGLSQYWHSAGILLWVAIGFAVGMIIIGLLTFQRLIERRVRGTEYLRAINRIHRYFVQGDPALAPFYYWPPCDDIPSFIGKTSATTGLRDLVAAFNSLFIGVLVALSGVAGQLPPALYLPVGLAVAALAWVLQQRYELLILRRAEKQAVASVIFPVERRQP
jgi:Flp pilus assembly protein TadB